MASSLRMTEFQDVVVCMDGYISTVPLWMLRRHFVHAIEREHGLCVERMLRPQCAVLIEGCDAILGRHIVRADPIVCGAHEV